MTESGERMLKAIPNIIKKDDPIINAMIANEKGTAAFEKMFAFGQEVIEQYSKNNDIYESKGAILDKIVSFFTPLERNFQESDDALKKRIKALFVRGGTTTWGTTWNIKQVFKEYFSNATIYLVENCGDYQKLESDSDTDINYIKNCSFENYDEHSGKILDWTLENAESNNECGFEGLNSIKLFDSTSKIFQTVEINENGIYFLHYFSCGASKVKIKVNDNYTNVWTVGENIEEVKTKSKTFYPTAKVRQWDLIEIFFNAKKGDNVIIEICGAESESYIDFVTLFKNMKYPKFCIFCRFLGTSIAKRTLSLAAGKNDPIENINYKNEQYLDNSFIVGSQGNTFAFDIYQDVLNIVKPSGIRGFIKIISSDNEMI